MDSETAPLTYPTGTPDWRAPEVILYEKTGKPYNIFKADLWALGYILYYLLFSAIPYSENELQAETLKEV